MYHNYPISLNVPSIGIRLNGNGANLKFALIIRSKQPVFKKEAAKTFCIT
jgi:hypothetical protein